MGREVKDNRYYYAPNPKLDSKKIGKIFKHWQVLRYVKSQNNGRRMYECLCLDCKKTKRIYRGITNSSKETPMSCGCLEYREPKDYMSENIFDGYTIYSNGEIYRNERVIERVDGVNSYYPKMKMNFQLDKDGYEIVCICKNSRNKSYKVHRLVAESFIPNPQNLPQVNHKDGDKTNNNIENLKWCSALQNNLHKIHELGYEHHNKSTKKRAVVRLNDGKRVEYPSIQEAARQNECNASVVGKVLKGNLKTYKGYKWEYKNIEGREG